MCYVIKILELEVQPIRGTCLAVIIAALNCRMRLIQVTNVCHYKCLAYSLYSWHFVFLCRSLFFPAKHTPCESVSY